jgi:enediyne biosynthesis protein E4
VDDDKVEYGARWTDDTGDGVAADDSIIGRALRRSFFVIAVIAAGVGIGMLVERFEAPPEPVVDAGVTSPVSTVRASDAIAPPSVEFTDVTELAGIDFVHYNGAEGERLLPETMGSGVAILDADADGDQDLFFVQGGPWAWSTAQIDSPPTSVLYLNLGGGQFATADTAFPPMYGMGVATGDYDADGLVDLFVTAVGSNYLFRNLGDGAFEDVTQTNNIAGADDAWSTSATFLDYDRDGDLDLFVANYVRWSRDIDIEVDYRLTGIGRAYGPPTNFEGTDSYLYRNDGEAGFTDVSAAAGIQVRNPATDLPMGKGLAVLAQDFDGDGWVDLAVANDTVQNFLFRNDQSGGFEEIGAASGLAFDNAGHATGAMGIDASRYRNDDDLAVAIGNFANEMTSFYVVHPESNSFSDEATIAGVGAPSRAALTFGLFFFDYDLDGRQDLFQTNGHVEDQINVIQPSQNYEQPSQLFWNCGVECPRVFQQVPAGTIGDLAQPVVGRGASYGDLDGDGDLDLVITQVGRAPLVLRNDQDSEHHWIRVKTTVGATVEVTVGEETQTRVVTTGRSYLSQVEHVVTFGLGEHDRIDSVRVSWPDGGGASLQGVDADQTLSFRH